jgi:PIN domain nuclease of toxin-antitoxin system
VRLLLDTHIMLWWALGDVRLPARARSLILEERNACFVSVASLWEVSIKSGLGKGLPLGVNAPVYLSLIEEAGFSLLDVRKEHALAVEGLPPHHGDPFDRLMIAQATVEGLQLMTHDKLLAAYGDPVLLV